MDQDKTFDIRYAQSTIVYRKVAHVDSSSTSNNIQNIKIRQASGDDIDFLEFDDEKIVKQQSFLQKQLFQSMMASKMWRQEPLTNLKNKTFIEEEGDEEHEFHENIINFNGIEASVFGRQEPLEDHMATEEDNQDLVQHSMILSKIISTKDKTSTTSPGTKIWKTGMLFKKSKKFFVSYQATQCTLEDKMLKCFKEKNRQRAKCVLNFEIFHFQCQSRIIDGKVKEFSLSAVGSDIVFAFKGQNDEDTSEWLHLIQQIISESHKQREGKYFLSTFNKFWKKHLVDNKQFREQASSGDLILFRGKSLACKLQRLITGSDYDHVGLVMSDRAGSLFVLEATGNIGVGIFSWDTLVKYKWFELYDKIVFRKLILAKNDIFNKKLEEFVVGNLGKSYQISVSKILRNESAILVVHRLFIYQKNSTVVKDRTYFCSELVAAAYKSLSLLPSLKSSAQYWPGSFSNENTDLVLQNGAQLSDEYLIGFNM